MQPEASREQGLQSLCMLYVLLQEQGREQGKEQQTVF